jgi:hypothetical protein
LLRDICMFECVLGIYIFLSIIMECTYVVD